MIVFSELLYHVQRLQWLLETRKAFSMSSHLTDRRLLLALPASDVNGNSGRLSEGVWLPTHVILLCVTKP